MVDITELSAIIASSSLVAGAIYYAFQIRNQTNTRKSELMLRIFPQWHTDAIKWRESILIVGGLEFKGYDDFVKNYGDPNGTTKEATAWALFSNYMEYLGALLKRKVVDADMISVMLSPAHIVLLWEKVRKLVIAERDKFGDKTIGENFEYLYDEMKKKEEKRKKKEMKEKEKQVKKQGKLLGHVLDLTVS